MKKRMKLIGFGMVITFNCFLLWGLFQILFNNNIGNKLTINNQDLVFNETVQLYPGDYMVKPLIIKNVGSKDTYYKIYLDHISGELKEIVIFHLYQDDNLLYSCIASQFNFVSTIPIQIGETHVYSLKVEILTIADNQYQFQYLNFNITLKVVDR